MSYRNNIKSIYDRLSHINEIHNSSFINTKLELYKLLLNIIEYYDNDNDKFKNLYISSLSDIKLNEYYDTILFYPHRESHFNSFDNVNDFIAKVCSSVPNENFYKELIQILETKINICENNSKRRRINN